MSQLVRNLSLFKSEWAGNKWPCVDIDPYDYSEFLIVLHHLCNVFSVDMPSVFSVIDVCIADLEIHGSPVTLHMDNWTFSVAAQDEVVRDLIFDALEHLSI